MNAQITDVAWSVAPEARDGSLLVIGLHGRGADERAMIAFAGYLPAGVTVAAPRAPIPEAGGFAWFANRGIGRPIEESIKDSADALFRWMDSLTSHHSGVALLGFSGGTAMAGGLLLTRPQGFAGAALLAGTLPWDAGLDTSRDRLAGIPVLWGNDQADPVIPRDLVIRSEIWLRSESGAELTERHYPGAGHAVAPEQVRDVQVFLADLAHSRRDG